jgi:preprotein translocase subunit Sec63
LAKKYGMEVSQATQDVLKNPGSSTEERKEALKYVIRRLQLALHPDKTARLPEEERKNREEDFKVLNNAEEKL